MTMHAGVWIDHRKAVLVMVSETGETTLQVDSNAERHVRFSGGTAPGASRESASGAGEDTQDRHFEGQLARYYDEVISGMKGVDTILLFGPGEAKTELSARIGLAGLGSHVVGVEACDKMTDHQVAAKVRDDAGRFLTAHTSRKSGGGGA